MHFGHFAVFGIVCTGLELGSAKVARARPQGIKDRERKEDGNDEECNATKLDEGAF